MTWTTIPFEQCLIKVKTPPKLPKKDYLPKGRYPVISQEAKVISGFCNDRSMVFHVASPIVVFGDHTRVLKYVSYDFVMGADGLKILYPNKRFNPKFFYYSLQKIMPRSTGYARHFRLLKKLNIPCPPLAEQERIVAKLDAAFAAINQSIILDDKKEAEVEQLKAALLSASLAGDDWKTVKLGEVCEIKPPKRQAKSNLSDDDLVSFVPMNNLNILSKNLTLEESKPLGKVYGSYTYFADGDVLLAKITPCFENGKIGIASGLVNGVGFGSSEYNVFRSRGEVLPDYLFYFLSQDTFRKEGEKVMSGAVGHKRVPKEFIEEYTIPLPPLAEQERIVAKLDAAFAELETARTAIAETKANYQALRAAILAQELQPKESEAA